MDKFFINVYFSISPNKIGSKIIANFQDGISHCGIRFKLPLIDKWWVFEARGHGGLSYSNPYDFEKEIKIVEEYKINCVNDEIIKVLNLSDSMLRSPYGYFGLFGMVFVLICKKLGGWTMNPFPWGYFCSQATYKILKNVFKFYVDGDPDENRVGPDDLRNMLKELSKTNPDKVKLIS